MTKKQPPPTPVPGTLRIQQHVQTFWQSHKDNWLNCTRCDLHKNVCNRVLARGTLPCQILFIGEAPGEVEDAIGRPFIGPAGRILQAVVEASQDRLSKNLGYHYNFAVTNVVACKPFGSGDKIEAPPKEAILTCSERVINFVNTIAMPTGIIALGKVAEKHLLLFQKKCPAVPVGNWKAVYHPSYILRKGGLNSLEFKRTLLSLIRHIEPMLTPTHV